EASRAIKAGCGLFKRNVTVSSAVLIKSRLRYQDLRGLVRSLSSLLPRIRTQVHLTSAAVKGLPSCQLTPCRSLKVSAVISALHDHLVARSGSIGSIRFWGTSCLIRTK